MYNQYEETNGPFNRFGRGVGAGFYMYLAGNILGQYQDWYIIALSLLALALAIYNLIKLLHTGYYTDERTRAFGRFLASLPTLILEHGPVWLSIRGTIALAWFFASCVVTSRVVEQFATVPQRLLGLLIPLLMMVLGAYNLYRFRHVARN